jgi:hypothetical protein
MFKHNMVLTVCNSHYDSPCGGVERNKGVEEVWVGKGEDDILKGFKLHTKMQFIRSKTIDSAKV